MSNVKNGKIVLVFNNIVWYINIPEQGLQKEQHGMHYFCSHFSQHLFPSVSFVRPEVINQGSLKFVVN